MSTDSRYEEYLERLCILAGISLSYRDFYGQEHFASIRTKQLLLQAMNIACDTEEQLLEGIDRLELAPWRRLIPPVLVQKQTDNEGIPFSLPADDIDKPLAWEVAFEDGTRHSGEWHPHQHPPVERHEVDGSWRERRMITFDFDLPLGYHQFSVCDPAGSMPPTTMRWIITPAYCYIPESVTADQGIYGVALQLYSLREPDDWGIGSFGSLRRFAQNIASTGVNIIGLNPLHELSPSNPSASSPYSPSSRLTLNTIYLDIPEIPDFADSEYARSLYYHPELVVARAEAREREIIDYASIVMSKRKILEACYESFQHNHLLKDTHRSHLYQEFLARGGPTLARLCTFNVLAEKFANQGIRSWHEWPQAYQDVNSPEVIDIAQKEHKALRFFAYLQWESERQLAAAQDVCSEMAVGIYCDLAVGVDSQSADTWTHPGLYAQHVGVGAPPDPLSAEGQGWGLVPFSPLALYEDGYSEFSKLLQANMRYAGALRIDHAMALLRLYWIPDTLPASEGAYVLYRVEDLFHIVALESHRCKCMVIGEDLGTLPYGFRERLDNANLLSYRLLRFERQDGGGFIPAESYPRRALASVGTHDLPTWAGFWYGEDIRARAEIGWVHDLGWEENERQQERERLLQLLIGTGDLSEEDAAGLWGGPKPDQNLEPLITAAYRFVARTPSLVAMVQIEDLIEVRTCINIPGTTNEHPNWRRRLPLNIEEITGDGRTQRILATLRSLRPVGRMLQESPSGN